MEGFKEYESKPVKRLAYRITGEEELTSLGNREFSMKLPAGNITFKAYTTIFPGDYIVHLDGKRRVSLPADGVP